MARTSDPNSATSQFFISVVHNPSLDMRNGKIGYAVFGRVTEGMDVIDEMTQEDDPGDPAIPDGPGFAVPGLQLLDADPDGMVGRYLFPNDPADAPELLRENVTDALFGMPRDLTGEGDVDGDDHALDYRLLPVAAVIEWRSSTGQNRILRFETCLTKH